MKHLWIYLLGILAAFEMSAQGLIGLNDPTRDYLRLLQIKGKSYDNPIVFHTNRQLDFKEDTSKTEIRNFWSEQLQNYFKEEADLPGLNVYLISPRIDHSYNSRYSRTYNDGPLWSGRGSNLGVNAGVRLKWGPVTGVIYPNYSRSENNFFKVQSRGETNLDPRQHVLNYQLSNRIDWVQLYGLESFTAFDWGQSSLSAEFGPLRIKYGIENMWWGSARYNPILMSNTAPGFKHLNIGTTNPITTKYGDFEANAIWGRLAHSEYNDLPITDKRYIVGFTFGYRPSFSPALKGLSIGLQRVLYQDWSGIGFADIFLALRKTGTISERNDGLSLDETTDQYLSMDLRWFFEEADTEFYMEWARNDFWLNFSNLSNEPIGVFTIGFQNVMESTRSDFRFGFEHTSLAAARTSAIDVADDFYTHSGITQGYTHEGQLLGAPIGPGSKSQTFTVDRFDKKGKYGFSINRIRFNDNFYWRRYGPTGDFLRHDVEWNFGFEAVRYFRNYEFSGKLIYSRRMNWHFYHSVDVNNFQFLTTVRWHITPKPILTLFNE